MSSGLGGGKPVQSPKSGVAKLGDDENASQATNERHNGHDCHGEKRRHRHQGEILSEAVELDVFRVPHD